MRSCNDERQARSGGGAGNLNPSKTSPKVPSGFKLLNHDSRLACRFSLLEFNPVPNRGTTDLRQIHQLVIRFDIGISLPSIQCLVQKDH